MEERLRFIARLLDGEKMAGLCREFGISRKTGYKIYDRYLDGLTDRSRRPYRHANQLPMQVEKLIVALKKEYPRWGAPKIRARLRRRYPDLSCPAISTVHAVLDRHGLVTRLRGVSHQREPGQARRDRRRQRAGRARNLRRVGRLESNLYGQIVKERIEVIRTLQDKIDENAREKVIQQYLFDHLWLLDPSWERTEGSEVMETRVRKLFDDVDAELSEEELKGRLDIAYRNSAGKHVIIELKRPQLRVGILNIVPRQIEKYYTGMRKMLDQQNLQDPIEIVLLLGTEPREWNDETRRTPALGTLRQYYARIVFYDQLLNDAYDAYREYLDRRLHVDRLAKVMQAIDDYAPEDGD